MAKSPSFDEITKNIEKLAKKHPEHYKVTYAKKFSPMAHGSANEGGNAALNWPKKKK